jgi:hypothetical protein
MKTLPLPLEELWTRTNNTQNPDEHTACIMELGRFMSIDSRYKDYTETFQQTTSRNFNPRDMFDLFAYMTRNSKNNFISDDVTMIAADEYFNTREQESLLQAYSKKAAQMLYDQTVIHSFIWDQCKEIVSKINTFKQERNKDLVLDRDFIDLDHDYGKIRAINLFDHLSVENQYKISTQDWSRCPDESHSPEFLIVTKMLFDYLINAAVAKRHPYLNARRGSMSDISREIIKNSDDSESRLRILATSYSIVSGIRLSELTTKCLIFKRMQE